MKKINQLWRNGISVLFWMSGAKVRDHAGLPGASSTQQTKRSRTLVDPVSLFLFVGRTAVGPTSKMSISWHDRRKLKPECTDRIGNRELDRGDICRRGGQSCSSPGLLHPTSATAGAWFLSQMIGTAAAVPACLQFVGQIARTGNEKPVTVVDTRVYKRAYQSMGSVCSEWSTDDSQLSELEEADARNVVDVLRQRHPTVDKDSQISDAVNGLKIDVRHPHSGTASLQWCRRRLEPNHISSVFERLRRSRLELIHALTLSLHVDIRVARRAASWRVKTEETTVV